MVYRRYGGPDVLESAELPEPKVFGDAVKVRIKAAGLNPADLGLQAGAMDAMVDALFPVTPGWDFAGVVEEAGFAVSGWKPGDEVIGFARGQALHYGTYAQKAAIPDDRLVRKPRTLGWEQAAGLPLAGLTAYQAVVRVLAVDAGDTVLVHGASVGVGHLAAQIAVARGARVIGTASEAGHAFLESVGVRAVRYGEGLAERVLALAPGGVTAVLDTVGRGVLAGTDAVAGPGVRVASVAGSTDHPAVRPVFARWDAADLLTLVELAEADRLTVRIAAAYPLDQAARAQQALAGGHPRGKIVLITE